MSSHTPWYSSTPAAAPTYLYNTYLAAADQQLADDSEQASSSPYSSAPTTSSRALNPRSAAFEARQAAYGGGQGAQDVAYTGGEASRLAAAPPELVGPSFVVDDARQQQMWYGLRQQGRKAEVATQEALRSSSSVGVGGAHESRGATWARVAAANPGDWSRGQQQQHVARAQPASSPAFAVPAPPPSPTSTFLPSPPGLPLHLSSPSAFTLQADRPPALAPAPASPQPAAPTPGPKIHPSRLSRQLPLQPPAPAPPSPKSTPPPRSSNAPISRTGPINKLPSQMGAFRQAGGPAAFTPSAGGASGTSATVGGGWGARGGGRGGAGPGRARGGQRQKEAPPHQQQQAPAPAPTSSATPSAPPVKSTVHPSRQRQVPTTTTPSAPASAPPPSAEPISLRVAGAAAAQGSGDKPNPGAVASVPPQQSGAHARPPAARSGTAPRGWKAPNTGGRSMHASPLASSGSASSTAATTAPATVASRPPRASPPPSPRRGSPAPPPPAPQSAQSDLPPPVPSTFTAPPTTANGTPAPLAPRQSLPSRNRVSTGGPASKPKLPSADLEARIAAIREKNAAEEAKRRVVELERAREETERKGDLERLREFRERQIREEGERREKERERKKRSVALQEAINAERAKNAAAKLRKVQGRDWDASKLDAEAPAIRPSELPRPASPSPPSSPTPASRYADTEVWDSVEHRSDEEVAREKERKRQGEEAARAAAEAAKEARETAQREEKEREERRKVREASEPTMVKGRGEKLGGSKGMRSMWDS